MQGKMGLESGEIKRSVRAAVRTAAQNERHGTWWDGGLGKGQGRGEGTARGQNMLRGRSSGRTGRTAGHRRSAKQSEGQGLMAGQGRAGYGRLW